MRIYYSLSAGLSALLVMSACSQTETTRTDEITVENTEATDSSSSEANQIIEIVEERIHSSYEERGIRVVSADMVLEPSGDYSGEAVVIDPTTNERITLNCTATGVEGGAGGSGRLCSSSAR